ncbi:hypothetical protein Tco_0618430 [Tanacetum coccineum]
MLDAGVVQGDGKVGAEAYGSARGWRYGGLSTWGRLRGDYGGRDGGGVLNMVGVGEQQTLLEVEALVRSSNHGKSEFEEVGALVSKCQYPLSCNAVGKKENIMQYQSSRSNKLGHSANALFRKELALVLMRILP